MKKTITSLILFVLMLLTVFYFQFKVNSICQEIVDSCNNLEEIIFNENWDESYKRCVNLLDYIQESYSSLAIYVTHTEIDNLRTETAKLSEYIETKELPEAMASTHYVKFTAQNIKNMQEVNIENVF